jgi:hypothetical protein
MDDSNEQPLFPQEQLPDPAWFQKIDAEMKELAEKIPVVARQPSTEKIWCKIGSLWYGHPVTPLILRYRALIWLKTNPPDPRGEKMAKRPAPYTVYARRRDLPEVINQSLRTVDRMMALTRESLGYKPYSKITVEQFCFINELPEDEIQQKLGDLQERRRKHKTKSKDEDDDY